MAECKIVRCKCVSEQQNKLYDKYIRVWNPIGKGNQSKEFRCTVCDAEIKSNISTIPKKKENIILKYFWKLKNYSYFCIYKSMK